MSNTQTAAKKAAQNGTDGDEAQAKKAAQEAQVAEAEADSPTTVEFDGHTYEILEGQPSPKAVTYIARYAVDGENLAFVPAMMEILGREQWADWCDRHKSEQMLEFFGEIDRALYQGN